jgi:hypothetical protein
MYFCQLSVLPTLMNAAGPTVISEPLDFDFLVRHDASFQSRSEDVAQKEFFDDIAFSSFIRRAGTRRERQGERERKKPVCKHSGIRNSSVRIAPQQCSADLHSEDKVPVT